jgi:hypothetical protein
LILSCTLYFIFSVRCRNKKITQAQRHGRGLCVRLPLVTTEELIVNLVLRCNEYVNATHSTPRSGEMGGGSPEAMYDLA